MISLSIHNINDIPLTLPDTDGILISLRNLIVYLFISNIAHYSVFTSAYYTSISG